MAEKEKKDGREQRQHYRIHYPLEERPWFEHQKKKYAVVDVSEKGLAFKYERGDPITTITKPITGQLTFKAGDTVSIAGKILRFSEDTVIMQLSTGIPLAIIMKEQRFLLQKYGHLGK
jgi:hypothetical protein